MRHLRLALVTAAFSAAFTGLAAPAQAAAVPDVSDYVTVEFQGPVVCVTYPCPQPMPVVVCVHEVAEYCTPR